MRERGVRRRKNEKKGKIRKTILLVLLCVMWGAQVSYAQSFYGNYSRLDVSCTVTNAGAEYYNLNGSQHYMSVTTRVYDNNGNLIDTSTQNAVKSPNYPVSTMIYSTDARRVVSYGIMYRGLNSGTGEMDSVAGEVRR